MIPDIKKSNISITTKHTQGYDEKRCIEALWLIYNFIKENNFINDNSDQKLRELYSIGVLGDLITDGSLALTVDYQKKDTKVGAYFTSPKNLFSLEKYGFSITDLKLADITKQKNKLSKKDVLQFRFSYLKNDNLLLGLKLFATACSKFRGEPFFVGDIRIMFIDAPKNYSPPVEEIFYVLSEDQRHIANMIHNKLEALGCTRNVTEYFHPKTKNKPFTTIYTHIGFWFFDGVPEGKGLVLKLNLRNIGGYADYLSECKDSIQQSVLNTTDCSGCKKACAGIRFQFNNKKYVKCPWHIFRFNDLSEQAVGNYIKLLELEDCELRKKLH